MAFVACPKGREGQQAQCRGPAQGSGKNNNKKKDNDNNKPLTGAPTAVAAIATAAGGGHGPCGNKRPRQPSGSDEGGLRCPVHNSRHHGLEECWKIRKLTEQFYE
jgi:hypothetical protein